MHLTDTVYHASVEKNPFCKRRFPRINMRTDPYVASTLQQEFTFWGIWIIRHFNFLKITSENEQRLCLLGPFYAFRLYGEQRYRCLMPHL